MNNNKLVYKNYLTEKKNNKSILQKKSKNFSNVFTSLVKDFNDPVKTLSVLNKKYSFNFKISNLQKMRRHKIIAIIGMGGSILGAEAIYNFLKKKIKKKIYFFNNLNEEQIVEFKKKENFQKVLFIIISKSGTTIETLSNVFSLNIVKKNSKNVIIICEKKNSLLYNLAKKFNLLYIEHKKFIGGRFSVLSEVGVIPAYLMGINIAKLRSHLAHFLQEKNKFFLKESSVKLSTFMDIKKKNNLIFLNYIPELNKFLLWNQQLIAESLGKKNKGFLPVVSTTPKDHHSLLQLYLDGPKDKIFCIFSSENRSKIKVNFPKNMTNKNFLNKKYLSTIKIAQKKALVKSFIENNIPFREFIINKKDEEALGKLFSYFILETVTIAKLSGINPFDQPAVEQVKLYTKDLLS